MLCVVCVRGTLRERERERHQGEGHSTGRGGDTDTEGETEIFSDFRSLRTGRGSRERECERDRES